MTNINKRTKIVCTIGPSSWPPETLKSMISNGMNIARVNGAFADVPELDRVAKLVRSLSDDIGLMLDIKGHEVRLNKFEEPLAIKPGDQVILGNSDKDAIYPITYPRVAEEIKAGQIIMIDKGESVLEVTKIADGKTYCKVISGSVIKGGKGMNFPGAHLHNPAITSRDIEQIKFAVGDQWEYVAGSFIRNAEDVATIREHLKNSATKFIAKIEDQQGIDNFDEILAVSDGIMIARGDMGAEVPLEKLPFIQKQMIYKCNQAGKPVITATNMLESMIEKPFPTRAEVTDVANAILDGTDAIMTSGETSGGKYPVESVALMTKIAKENEQYLVAEITEPFQLEDSRIGVAICNAALEVATHLDVDKIVVVSLTGKMIRLMSRNNLAVPIYGFVNNSTLKKQMALVKGVEAFVFNKTYKDRDDAIKGILHFALEEKIVKTTDKILLIGKHSHTMADKSFFPNVFEYIEVSQVADSL